MTEFKKGDKVEKVGGDYTFPGTVIGVSQKLSGAIRYDVEDDRGAIHIYSEKNLRHASTMKPYIDLVKDIMKNGVDKTDRTGTGTRSVFGRQIRFNLKDGFPLLTEKKTHWKSIVHELIWFLKGETNIKYLKENGVKIWDEWADENGDLGPVYGAQWRSWPTPKPSDTINQDIPWDRLYHLTELDQIENVINSIKNNPDSRRHIVTAWNPAEVDNMALPPCHAFFQFYVANGKLSCQLYQRSADVFLGVPFNIASYALLTHLIAHVTELEVGDFVHTFGDAHLYSNHFDQALEMVSRTSFPLPKLALNAMVKDIDSFTYEDIAITDYESHPAIKAPVAV